MRNNANKALEDYGAYGGKSSSEILKDLSDRLENDIGIPDQINDYLKKAYEKLNDDKKKFNKA